MRNCKVKFIDISDVGLLTLAVLIIIRIKNVVIITNIYDTDNINCINSISLIKNINNNIYDNYV